MPIEQIVKAPDEEPRPEAAVADVGKVVDAKKPPALPEDNFVSINLKYFQPDSECFSKWQSAELKKFSTFVKKLRQHNWNQVLVSAGFECHRHKGDTKAPGFSKPTNVSPDIPYYGLRVDDKARVHGFVVAAVFYLVWLDKGHKVHS